MVIGLIGAEHFKTARPRIRRLSQRGDTLIEVTIALAILSMVLIAATVVGTQSFRLGQTARERTAIADAAQGQMETMRAFRDGHTWAQFLDGGSNPGQYKGVLNAAAYTHCHETSPCLHMEALPGTTFVPQDGPMDGPFTTSYVEMVVEPVAGANPNTIYVTVNYGFERLGGSQLAGHLKTTFTNLKLVVATPPPPAPLPCTGTVTDIVMVLDLSGSMKDTTWSTTGLSRLAEMDKAAGTFIDNANISFPANHVAVVDFNDFATIDYPLGWDPVAAKNSLIGLPTRIGTNYVPGLAAAGGILAGARPGAGKVIVFLSDGFAHDKNAAQAIQAEMSALPAGTKMFTIGIRADGEDMSLLYTLMPMNGGFYSDATDAATLKQIMLNIAGEITCN